MKGTRKEMIRVFRSWIGASEKNGQFKNIIDIYNSKKPLPRGYAVHYDDEWCDTALSACSIAAGCDDLTGRECGVDKHIEIFKKLSIWIEDGSIKPKSGDIICYNWDDQTQPNDGSADHIGLVEKCGKNITVIEGNHNGMVDRRVIPVGWGYIRGYARPHYAADVSGSKTNSQIAKEVIAGQWGYGAGRKQRLKKAGYDYAVIQQLVNGMLHK